MNEKKILVGDIVAVNFNNAQLTLCHRGKVLSYPCATGDSWVIEDCVSGDIHYISEGCTLTKIPLKTAGESNDWIGAKRGPLLTYITGAVVFTSKKDISEEEIQKEVDRIFTYLTEKEQADG